MRKTLSFILSATLCASLVARAEAGSEKTTVFGPLALTTTSSARLYVLAAESVHELLFVDSGPCKAVLSIYFDTEDGTLLKQEAVTIELGKTATLSMSGLAFGGQIIGTVRFDSSAALTVEGCSCIDVDSESKLTWSRRGVGYAEIGQIRLLGDYSAEVGLSSPILTKDAVRRYHPINSARAPSFRMGKLHRTAFWDRRPRRRAS